MKLPKYVIIIIFLSFSLIVLLPIFFMFAAAFFKNGQISTDFFKVVFLSHRQWRLIKNSLLLSTEVTLLSLVLGTGLAFFLERTNLWGRYIFRLIYFIPLLIPPLFAF